MQSCPSFRHPGCEKAGGKYKVSQLKVNISQPELNYLGLISANIARHENQ